MVLKGTISPTYSAPILCTLLKGDTHMMGLAEKTGKQTGNMRGAVDTLISAGLIASKRVGKRNMLSLTRKGRIHAMAIESQRMIPEELSDDEERDLLHEYQKVFSAIGRLAMEGLFSDKAIDKCNEINDNTKRLQVLVASIIPGIEFSSGELYEEYVRIRPFDGLNKGNVSTYLNRYRKPTNGLRIKGLKKLGNAKYVIES